MSDRSSPRGGAAWTLGMAALLLGVVPAILALLDYGYFFRLAQLAMIFAILSASLNLTAGTTGLLSLGHAAFYGVGAYVAALLSTRAGLPPALTIPAAFLFTAGLAAILALPTIRLVRIFFAVATLSIGELINLTLSNWNGLTNGPMGVRGIPGMSLFGVDLSGRVGSYYAVAVVAIAAIWAIHRLTHSYWGNMLRAVREDDQAAMGMGIRVARMKVAVFAISSGFAGVAGALLAHSTNFISPDMFRLTESILILTMVVVGGLGSVAGAVAGACLLVFLPELGREVGHFRMVIVGIVLFAAIVALPRGLVGEVSTLDFARRHLGRAGRSDPPAGWR